MDGLSATTVYPVPAQSTLHLLLAKCSQMPGVYSISALSTLDMDGSANYGFFLWSISGSSH